MAMRTRSAARASARKTSKAAKQEGLPVDLFAGLNPEQLAVVQHLLGACRVLASAGSGKTEALARRIAHMVRTGVDPQRICAITFSKKGADEMVARIAKKFGVSGASVSTWHALCLRIIREDRLPQSSWTVEGDKDAGGKNANPKMILKDVIGWKGMDWKGCDLAALTGFIGKCKANLYAPDSAEALALAQTSFGWQASKATRAFALYNEALADKMLLTFDDFLVVVADYLASDENARLSWSARFDFGLQDEAQDANRAQQTIAHLLFKDHGNYMAIGDCFQAIYGFRGSSPEFLAKFEQEWPEAKTITLPRNYRSGKRIIEVANKIVQHATVDGLDAPGQMIGEREHDGEVKVLCAESLDDEAREIATRITTSVNAGDSKLGDHTILFRTNAQSRALEEALLASRVPYVVVGGVSFYERKEVRDLLAYLRLAARRATVDDIKRSINTPFRFLGAKFVERVMDEVRGEVGEVDWCRVVDEVAGQTGIQRRQMESANGWARMIRDMQKTIDAGADAEAKGFDLGSLAREAARPSTLLESVVKATRYIDWLNQEEGGETTENSGAANVREMVRVAERFATAGELLDYIEETIRAARKQRDDKQAGGERVLLMSVHRSKGLEWPHVYVAGMNEMVLPHVKGDAQEERRLAYVAVTRARDVLTMSYVRRIATPAGIRDVEPSRFIRDTGLGLDLPEMHGTNPTQEALDVAP